jgi:pimeloyl-ACP methyl ester carboxylesterase
MKRVDSDFASEGTRCGAWLFLPDPVAVATPPPVVVMAHGFGGQREMRLPAFAEHFASRGLAALVFDYRCFGASEGSPRNWIDPRRHLADWRAAIEHARSLPEVDTARLGLWGTSFSGGHVLATAAALDGVSAVVSQVPFVGLDRSQAPRPPLGQIVRLLTAGWLDVLRGALGASPYTVRIVGTPEESALLNAPDVMDAFRKLVPPGSSWRNETPARVIFHMARYQPLDDAGRITCPVLLVAAENDSLIPIASVDAAARRIPDCEYVRLRDTSHFEPYTGEVFHRVVDLEADFLCRHLLGHQVGDEENASAIG